jgi:hypothetical protein
VFGGVTCIIADALERRHDVIVRSSPKQELDLDLMRPKFRARVCKVRYKIMKVSNKSEE